MSDRVDLYPTCPQCGSQLLIEQLGDKPEAHDRVFCPDHGTIGAREEVSRATFDKAAPDIGKNISEQFRDMLRKAGFEPG